MTSMSDRILKTLTVKILTGSFSIGNSPATNPLLGGYIHRCDQETLNIFNLVITSLKQCRGWVVKLYLERLVAPEADSDIVTGHDVVTIKDYGHRS